MALWPNSPFAVPVSSFIEPVPVPGVDPLTGDCRILRVNKAWLPYIAGALQQLILQTTWQGDEATVTEAQAQAMNLILALADAQPGGCEPEPAPIPIAERDYKMSICEELRYMNGKLQGLCCGEWTDIPGQPSNGPQNPSQPGAGSEIPAPNGGTAEYCGALSGLQLFYLPVPVSTGDVLLASNLDGASNDGVEVYWHCPTGALFALDTCVETPIYNGGTDPLIGTQHMSIIAKIGSVYYNVLNVDTDDNPQPFTVPSGHDGDQCILLYNCDYGGKIYGETTFCVNVTNNSVGAWSMDIDLKATPAGFAPQFPGAGTWIPAQGLVADCGQNPVDHNWYMVAQMLKTMTWLGTTHLTRFQAFYDLTVDTFIVTNANILQINGSTVITAVPITGNGQDMDWSGDVTSPASLVVAIVGCERSTDCGIAAGVVYALHLEGTGPKPTF